MMKTNLLCTLLLCSFSILTAQTLSGSWELTEKTGSENKIIGSFWHFMPDGQLKMENQHGQLTMPYSITDNKVRFQTLEFQVESCDDANLVLGNDTEKLIFRALPASSSATSTPVTNLGDFLLRGTYYHIQESEPLIYHYYRFYENGDLLSVSSVMEPILMEPFLNRAYFSNEKDIRSNILERSESSSDDVLEYIYTKVPDPETERPTSITNRTFSKDGDKVKMFVLREWSDSDRTFDYSYELEYMPLPKLATWQGVNLNKENPGLAEELFMLPELPIPGIISNSAEEMPRFPGCEELTDEKERIECSQHELLKFIYMNISYPIEAREKGIEGTVVITFVVEKDGRVSNIRIVREIGGGCGEASKRIVELMNEQNIRWTPGKIYDEPVRVQFNLPVKFRLEGRKERRKRRKN